MRYKWEDLHIGDTIMTKNGEKGKILMLRSYSYINDMILRSITDISTILIDFMPFKFDDTKHKGIDYPTITMAAEVIEYGKTFYYIIDIDLKDIKKIIKTDEETIKKEKNFFNKYIIKIKNYLKNND